MMLQIPKVLNATQVNDCRASLLRADWADGRITAGHQSGRAKHNLQLPQTDPVARELSLALQDTLLRNPLFFSAALPRTIFPPLFNRYQPGQAFGNHIDNAVRYDNSQQPPRAVRTDLSATLFLSEPDEYDGGELVIEHTFGAQRVKLAAGDLVLYPASSLHRVEPITRGERLASFFWVQSLVRDEGERRLLFNLDGAIQRLTARHAEDPALIELTGVYHNLLRRWTEI